MQARRARGTERTGSRKSVGLPMFTSQSISSALSAKDVMVDESNIFVEDWSVRTEWTYGELQVDRRNIFWTSRPQEGKSPQYLKARLDAFNISHSGRLRIWPNRLTRTG